MASAATYQVLPLEQIIVGKNVRRQVTLDKDFVASIKENGVIQPVIVYPAPGQDGSFAVLEGQRRLLASIDLARPTIPAIVVDAPTTEQARIIEQLVVNEHRAPITEADEVAAIVELDGLGVTATQLAKKTRITSTRIKAARTVATSEAATAALAIAPITLEQAAALTEFDEDSTTVDELTAIAANNPSQLNHAIQRARLDRDLRNLRLEREQELTAKGYRVIERPSDLDGNVRFVGEVHTDENCTQPVVPKSEADTPDPTIAGLAVYARSYSNSALVDGTWTSVPNVRHTFVIENWEDHGYYVPTSRATAGGLTDEQKAERKITRDNNKLWQPATLVRLDWIREFLQRTDLPADALHLAASYFAPMPNWATSQRTIAPTLLGLNRTGGYDYSAIADYIETHPTRALNALLATALAATEGEYDFAKNGWKSHRAPAHLKQLAAWGYTLSDIEAAVVNGTVTKGIN